MKMPKAFFIEIEKILKFGTWLSGQWFAWASPCTGPVASETIYRSAQGVSRWWPSPGTLQRAQGGQNPAYAYWDKLKDLLSGTEADSAKKQAVVGTHLE